VDDAPAAPPELDVIIATNRHSPFLGAAVASVQAQHDVLCNIVVVDDGSPCPADIRGVLANVPRATVIRQAAAGVSAARNRGLAEGSARFVAFLDDDDVWLPRKSVRQIAALAQRPDAVASVCDGWYIDASGDVLEGWRWAAVEANPRLDYFAGTATLPRIVTTLFRRDVCELIGGFDERLRFGEDHEFLFRTLLHGEFVPVREKLMCYRQHADNVSRRPGNEVAARVSTELALDLAIAKCVEGRHQAEADLLYRQQRLRRSEWCLDSMRRIRATWRTSPRECGRELRWLASHWVWLPATATVAVHQRRQPGQPPAAGHRPLR
jgi:glycosyltransferase involved in cell wall biosynthesis